MRVDVKRGRGAEFSQSALGKPEGALESANRVFRGTYSNSCSFLLSFRIFLLGFFRNILVQRFPLLHRQVRKFVLKRSWPERKSIANQNRVT